MLRLLAGELKPQRGSARRPKTVVRCSQEATLDDVIRDFAWGWSDGAWALQARLGLDPADLERWDQLSPGERRRWQIAAAVAAAPDGLLLDEPTDHLDAEARAWLLTALQGYRGAARVAAHDRALLDALVHTTLRLDRGRVVVTAGGASAALAQAEEDQRAALAALEEAAEQVRSARAKLANARRDRSAAEDQGRTSARLKGPRDSDARSLGAKNRVSWADRAHGRRVEVERRALDRAAEAHAALPRPDEFGGTLQIASAPVARGRLVAWRGDLRAGSRCLARGLKVVVERGARLQIAGRTGSGKSTLLQVLQAVSTLPPARVLVLSQELSPTRAAEDLRRLRGLPTNHLDLPAIVTLARALQRFDGAITYVTHDPGFAAEVGGAVLTLGA